VAKSNVKRTSKSKSIKAGKNKDNKWLILAGVAVVALMGVMYVRLSSASNWVSIYRKAPNNVWQAAKDGGKFIGMQTDKVTFIKGRSYRVCARGYAVNGNSALMNLDFTIYKPTLRYQSALATKKYGSTSQLHCSATFKATKDYVAAGNVKVTSGSIKVTAVSVDELH